MSAVAASTISSICFENSGESGRGREEMSTGCSSVNSFGDVVIFVRSQRQRNSASSLRASFGTVKEQRRTKFYR